MDTRGPAVRVRGRGRHLDFVVDDEAPFEAVEQDLQSLLRRLRDRLSGAVVTLYAGRRLLNTLEMLRLRQVLLASGVQVAEVWGDGARLEQALSESTGLPISLSLPRRRLEVEPEFAPTPTRGSTLLVRGTCRSGSAIHHEGDVVVLGDVNPGAEVVATGDILVFGALRGMAHAGARGNHSAVIVALSLQPTQLRIGRLVGIGSEDLRPEEDTGPEIAYVTEDGIVIEPYTPLFHRW